jgi:hypothetical protein
MSRMERRSAKRIVLLRNWLETIDPPGLASFASDAGGPQVRQYVMGLKGLPTWEF